MYFILFGSSNIREYLVVFLCLVVGVAARDGVEGWWYSELKYVSYEKKNGVQKAPHKVMGSSFVRHAISIEYIIYIFIYYVLLYIHNFSRVLQSSIGINMCWKYIAAYTHIGRSEDCRVEKSIIIIKPAVTTTKVNDNNNNKKNNNNSLSLFNSTRVQSRV